MKEANILSGLMCQILHTRNSAGEGFLIFQQQSAGVSDEEPGRVQHIPTLNDYLIALEESRWWHR